MLIAYLLQFTPTGDSACKALSNRRRVIREQTFCGVTQQCPQQGATQQPLYTQPENSAIARKVAEIVSALYIDDYRRPEY